MPRVNRSRDEFIKTLIECYYFCVDCTLRSCVSLQITLISLPSMLMFNIHDVNIKKPSSSCAFLLHYKHFINVLMYQRNSIITKPQHRARRRAHNKIKTKNIFIKRNQIILKELKRK
jgi:hypothetical protein